LLDNKAKNTHEYQAAASLFQPKLESLKQNAKEIYNGKDVLCIQDAVKLVAKLPWTDK